MNQLIVPFVLLSLVAFRDSYKEIDVARFEAINTQFTLNMEKSTELLEQFHTLAAKIELSSKDLQNKEAGVQTLVSELKLLEVRLMNIRVDLGASFQEDLSKIKNLYWSNISEQISTSGGFVNYYSQNPSLQSLFIDFVVSHLSDITLDNRNVKSINFPHEKEKLIGDYWNDEEYQNVKNNFVDFYLNYGKNPNLLKTLCEQTCNLFYKIASVKQQLSLSKALMRYEALLNLSQQNKFQELAQNLLDIETKTARYSQESNKLRSEFTQAYPSFTLFELQAAYRHFSKKYLEWSELLDIAKKEFVLNS